MKKNTSLGRRGFLTSAAAAIVATGQSPSVGQAQNPPAPAVSEGWLSLTKEDGLEPRLPIIDPHHHFWNTPDRDPQRYLLEQLAADVKGHNVRQTVFIECGSMYRADGPEEFRVVGETEFVQGIAAESASGRYGDLRAAAGIIGTVDMRLGDRAAAVLEAHIAASHNRFRGIRHGGAWAAPGVLPTAAATPRLAHRPVIVEHLLLDSNFRKAFGYLQNYGL